MRNTIFASISALLLIAIIIFVVVTPKETPPTAPSAPGTSKQVSSTAGGLAPQAGLPPLVEAKRQAIYNAARTRNYDSLAKLAATPFEYSYGGGEHSEFAAYMRLSEETEGRSAFNIIPLLLSLPYEKQGDVYVWPSVFTKTAEAWTSEDIEMMKKIMSEKMIEDYRSFGAYAYYRIGIKEDGSWIYYIAGD